MGNAPVTSPINSNKEKYSNCLIVVIGPKSGDDSLTELRHLPSKSTIIGTGMNLEELQKEGLAYTEATVIFNVTGDASILAPIIAEMPNLLWIHSITAGVDHILCPAITGNEKITLTNAKGIYSPTLGEYVIGACLYFAKSFRRLENQKKSIVWERFDMKELKGATMGIVGYGDIGYECAKRAKVMGMHIVALRRNPERSANDDFIDKVLGPSNIRELMAVSDYVVVCCALTPETKGIISESALSVAKKDQVLINIGRGPLVDEKALISALESKRLSGAALDVFDVEPLPITSPLWKAPNLLISPHNADKTADFRHRSVKFFTENCQRFVSSDKLLCIVNTSRGY